MPAWMAMVLPLLRHEGGLCPVLNLCAKGDNVALTITRLSIHEVSICFVSVRDFCTASSCAHGEDTDSAKAMI